MHILIDLGSTHNFLDYSLAQKLELISTQSVAVADGNHLACEYVCRGFEWRMQNITFTSDVLIIPLGSCDMVLGVQWLSNLGTVKWDFKRLMMEFDYNNYHHVFREIPPKSTKTNSKVLTTPLKCWLMPHNCTSCN